MLGSAAAMAKAALVVKRFHNTCRGAQASEFNSICTVQILLGPVCPKA